MKKNLSISALIVMLLTTASRLLGFVRIFIISLIFGGGAKTDIINLVFTIPNNLRKMLAEGSLSSAFIPNLSSCIVKDDKSDNLLARNILGLLVLINIPLIAFSIYFSDTIIRILLNFKDNKSALLAGSAFKIMISYIFFVSISSIMIASLNSKKKFFVPALSPLIFSVSVITCVLLFYKKYDVNALSIGVFVGGLSQVLLLIPFYMLEGYSILPSFKFLNEDFKKTMEMWLPLLFSSFILVLNQQITMNFASNLKVGSATALSNAIVFFQLPQGIITNSIITVLFPIMSFSKSLGEDKKFSRIYQKGLSNLIALLAPVSLFILLYSKHLISIALMHGKFLEQNVIDTANTLNYYALGLVPLALMNFSQKTLYAKKNSIVVMTATILMLILDVFLSIYLKSKMGVYGLALAYSITCLITFFILFIFATDRYFSMGIFILDIFKSAICILPVVGVYSWVVRFHLLYDWKDINLGLRILNITLVFLVSVFGWFVVNLSLKTELAKMIFKKDKYFDQDYASDIEIITKKEEEKDDDLF